MNPFIRLILLLIIFQAYYEDTKCQTRWWQREIPSPSYNQIVNPEYINIKRDLERSLDEQNGLRERSKRFSPGSREEGEYKRMIGMYEGKIWDLEDKLAKTPMYIETSKTDDPVVNIQNSNQQSTEVNISSPTNSNSDATTMDNDFRMVLYRIKNCDRKSFKNNDELNGSSLKLFDNLKSQMYNIISSENTTLTQNSGDFAYEKEVIKCYGVFIDHWSPSIGTDEAKKEINKINKNIEKEINVRSETELSNNTDVIIHYTIIGNLPSEKEVKKRSLMYVDYKYYNYHLEIRSYSISSDVKFMNGDKKEYLFSCQNSGNFNPISFYNDGKYKNLKFEYVTYSDEPDNNYKVSKELSLQIPFTLGRKTILNIDFYLENYYVKDVKYYSEQLDNLPVGLNFDN
jgi:hypothetical protein